jgi:hypothetical protein
MHLTLAQAFPAVSTLAAGWLMVKIAGAKGVVKVRQADRCASCGRRRDRGQCHCTTVE